MAKDLFVAKHFGVSSQLDAYLVAFILPSFVVNVAAGAFHTSFLPTYIETRQREGQEAAQALFSAVTARMLLILTGGTVVLGVLGSVVLPIIGSGFDAPTLALCRSLFFLLLPSIVINGLAVLWGATLNSDDRFALAALAPMAVPSAIIVFLLLTVETWGVYAIGFGIVVGFIVQTILLGWSLKRRKLNLRPRWGASTPALRQVMNQYLPMVAGAALASSTDLVDQAMATPLGSGSVSALNYGIKITALLIGIGALALGNAVLPYFSRMVAVQDWKALRHTLKTYSLIILTASILVTSIIIVFSEPLTRLFFQRGAFTQADTKLVSQIQVCYALQLPFYFLGTLTVRVVSSLKANHILMLAAILNLLVNVSLNYVFIHWFGIVGIALSTSVVYLVSYSFVAFILFRRLRTLG